MYGPQGLFLFICSSCPKVSKKKNKSSFDLVVYVLKLFNRYLRRNVNTKSSRDTRVYSLLLPLAFNKYLRSNIDTKSPMDQGLFHSIFVSF